ncbi:MAG: type II toxin-antitoxin system VapC family toxin [Chitinivibrionales bacterium]|nr:type II toxin-antitoxin system VapC family toxin [Chitinivibrionales bacterium]
MNLFFDTSAFIKRYVEEIGSQEVESLCSSTDGIMVSILLPIEIIATCARLKREKCISSRHYSKIKSALLIDLRDITIIMPEPSVVQKTVYAIESSPLKTLDAIHLGSALECSPDYFVSSDKQQIQAALKLGLKVKQILL